jgi:hypothetical protein
MIPSHFAPSAIFHATFTFAISLLWAFRQKSVPVSSLIARASSIVFGTLMPNLWVICQYRLTFATMQFRFRSTSKGTFLRVNNNNENFSSDVLYFLGKNLKKVQDSCWFFRICANIQVSELQRHIFLGTLFRTPFHDFMFCLIWIWNHLDVSQTMMTSRMTR